MKARVIVAASSLSAALAAAVVLGIWTFNPTPVADQDLDHLVSASISHDADVNPRPAPPAMFSVSNLKNRAVCLAERGATLTSRSRSFWAPPDCDDVWPGLSMADNWTQNEDGTVTITSNSGHVVLTLAPGAGFSYESLDNPDADLAWIMLP